MALKKEKKDSIIKEFTGIAENAKSMVFVNFKGLTVAKVNNLRRRLQKEGVSYKVGKKTLVKRAISTLKIDGEMPEMEGETGVAYGTDLIAPAREIFNFQKENKDSLAILGGVFEGRFMNKMEMMEIASIPPIQVLYGKFVNIINSPIQRFAVVLNEIAKIKN